MAGLIILTVLGISAIKLADRWADRARSHDRWVAIAHVTDDPTQVRLGDDDGDVVLRLACVNVPEHWRAAALVNLNEQLAGRRVMVVFDKPFADRPVPGAAVMVYREDGVLINEWLIDDGWAEFDGDTGHSLGVWLNRLHDYARKSGRGMWK